MKSNPHSPYFLILLLAVGLFGASVRAEDYSSADGWRSLFNGRDMEGWEIRGGGSESPTFEVENGTIVGRTLIPRSNSAFACTTETFRDFELVFEMKVDKNLNSGVQIRTAPKGTVRGAQVEVENGSRKTGYIFGQGMGQWLSEDLPDGLSAHFKDGEWNRFRVLAIGQNIKTWINDEPFADLTHELIAPEGVIGLQVHGYPRGKYREAGSKEVLSAAWRNIYIRPIE